MVITATILLPKREAREHDQTVVSLWFSGCLFLHRISIMGVLSRYYHLFNQNFTGQHDNRPRKIPEEIGEGLTLTMTDPSSYEEAMSRHDAIKWKRACAEEMEQFVKQKIFDAVPKPTGQKVIGCKWVFKTKLDKDGQVERYKAKLVAQDFLQVPGVDFEKMFAPVIRYQMLQTLLALANKYHWHVHQMSIKSAFLNSDLPNEIYMRVPPGVESEEGTIWLLRKALYGLKQASREWYLKLKKELEDIGFKRSDTDHGIFTKNISGQLFVIAVYVDDCLLFSDDIKAVKLVKEKLSARFEIKDLGEAQWILQMRIERSKDKDGLRTLSISQAQYIESILERHGIMDSNPVKTSMMNNLQLPLLTQPEVDVTEYQRSIGSLMYLMVCTRPDIAYAVGVLSRHVACPGRVHLTTVKCIFRYL